MSARMMAPGTYRWLEWGTATADPRSRVLDHAGAMIFTGSTVRHAADVETDPSGRVVELVDEGRIRVAWACGGIGIEAPTTLRAAAQPPRVEVSSARSGAGAAGGPPG